MTCPMCRGTLYLVEGRTPTLVDTYRCASGHMLEIRRGAPLPSAPDRPPEPESPRGEPDRLTGRIIGFRGWTLDGYKLRSANTEQHGGFWKLGPNRAECRIEARHRYLAGGSLTGPVAPSHPAPDPSCECGWYAYFDVRRENNPHNFEPDALVWGAVAAWGLIEVHASGFRAEWAEPVVLAYHPRDPYEQVVRLRAMAGEMGLPCVTLDELPGEALKHGQEVPLELRPPEEEFAWPYSHFGSGLVPFGIAGAVTPSFASGGVVERRGLASLRKASERMQLVEEARQTFGLMPGPLSQWLAGYTSAARAAKVAPEPKGRKIRGVKAHLKTVGPPTLGKHREGDVISDRRGDQYVCVRSGKPGSWQAL